MVWTVILIAILATTTGSLWVRTRRIAHQNKELEAVVSNQEDFTFLVDDGFEVKQTNAGPLDPESPRLLGNVLHCKHSLEKGHCGEAELCKSCPVRFVIRKSFERRSGFDAIEASMELLGADANAPSTDVDVIVGGRYVNINEKPHMVVNVRTASDMAAAKPKLLFISRDVELYGRVREAIGKDYRILSADTLKQAYSRLVRRASLGFSAVLIDSDFLDADDTLRIALTEGEHLPLFVFTPQVGDRFADDADITQLETHFDEGRLRTLLLQQKTTRQ